MENKTKQINVQIDYENLIQEDYVGFGGNSWNSDLSREGVEFLGMTDAHFDLNAKRIAATQPAMMRIMIMPHYLMFLDDPDKGEAKWNAGVLNFESSYMRSFFKYAEAYKNAGTEILLNYGGAVISDVVDWYGITGAPDSNGGTRSCPDNLEAFARNLRLLLEECYRRDLYNINAINFHNEISWENYSTYGDKRIYWVKMLELCHKELKAAGLRDKVKIMGVDIADNGGFEGEFGLGNPNNILGAEAFKYVYDNAKDPVTGEKYYDQLSIHIYMRHDCDIWNLDTLKRMMNNMYDCYGSMWMTEFATYSSDAKPDNFAKCPERLPWFISNSFEVSRAAQMWAHANSGFAVSLHWYYFGGYIPKPICNYQRTDEEIYLYYNMWNCPSDKALSGGVDKVSTTFGELSLLMRYVPKHSKVLKVTAPEDDLHITAFETRDGKDISIVVETNKGDAKNISVNLGKFANRTFRKHIYKYPCDINSPESVNQYDANAIVPVGEEITVVNGNIEDSFDGGHYLAVYTTLPQAQQVCLENPALIQQEIKAGESVGFGKIFTVGLETDDVSYSIITGNGSISADGIYTADKDAKAGDFISVKIASADKNAKHEAYAVALIKIID